MRFNRPADARLASARAAGLGAFVGILCVILALLFLRSFAPGWVLFANDGPLGALMAERSKVPEMFTGSWSDLNGYGSRDTGASPNITFGLLWILGPLGFSKFYAPITLLILGTCAWFFFRQLGLGTLAALLGGLAAALTSDFFGVSCWGVGPQAICFGLNYLALAIVVSPQPLRPWIRYPLAGLAVGLGVMEAFDIGAIFSVVTAIFVAFHPLLANGRSVKALIQGGAHVAVIAVFAVFMAAAALSSLIGTQIKGIVGTEQDQRSKEERWDWATQWSVPKREALGFIVPGLFGYRMQGIGPDPGDGSYYWGASGRDPAWERYYASGKQGAPPRGVLRYGGGGSYMGVVVVVIALWAFLQSLRKEKSVYSLLQRRFIWFCTGLVVVSLLLGFGRYAPFYQLFYALPYASTIRNPAKFIHVLQWVLLIIFAFGVHGLSRSCFEAPAAATRGLVAQLQVWWKNRSAFDRHWVLGAALALGASLVAWFAYLSSRSKLVSYLQEVQFDEPTANAIASFSFRQVGFFILLLAVALGFLTVILSGYFNGRRARVGAVLLGLLVVADLTHVSARWVISYNWKEKYLEAADNGVIQFLRQNPREGRVTVWPFGLPAQLGIVQQVYNVEWLQHLFQYYNIQSLDIIQMPRVPLDVAAFEGALAYDNNTNNLHRIARRWQLTNTRYLIGAAGLSSVLNSELDPQRRFRPLLLFEFYQTKAGGPILTRTNATGPFALFEFTGALPRVQLHAHWQVNTNDDATLAQLASKEFDPAQTVLIADPLPAPAAASATNATGGTVEFVSYAPKHVVLRAKAPSPGVLLLNDKYDPNWKVRVGGKAAPLLRCNYIMRGVYLEPGEHTVEFSFEPPVDALYVSLGAIALGLVLSGFALGTTRRSTSRSEPETKPA